MDHLLMLL
jgi:hypothetical protein